MNDAIDVLVVVLAWIGAAFVLIAAIGVVRMPDLFGRLQASSKASTLGIALLAIALALHVSDGAVAVRAAALVLILVVTAPIAAHVIARAAFVSRAPLEPGTELDPEARALLAAPPGDRASADPPRPGA